MSVYSDQPFDAGEIAATAIRNGEDPLAVVLHQLVGYASVCWESLNEAGVFQSDQAAAATASVLAYLRPEPVPYVCPAALNIKGEHYPCETMSMMVEGSENHDGWAHMNREAEAIWSDDPENESVQAGAVARG